MRQDPTLICSEPSMAPTLPGVKSQSCPARPCTTCLTNSLPSPPPTLPLAHSVPAIPTSLFHTHIGEALCTCCSRGLGCFSLWYSRAPPSPPLPGAYLKAMCPEIPPDHPAENGAPLPLFYYFLWHISPLGLLIILNIYCVPPTLSPTPCHLREDVSSHGETRLLPCARSWNRACHIVGAQQINLRLKEVRSPSEGHRTGKWQSWDLNAVQACAHNHPLVPRLCTPM